MSDPYRTAEQPEIDYEWAIEAARQRSPVFHLPTGVVDRVTEFHRPNEYRDRSGNALRGPVVVLSGGHSLIANKDAFVVLDAGSWRFFRQLQQAIGGIVRVSAQSAARRGMNPETGLDLLLAALRNQLRLLEVG